MDRREMLERARLESCGHVDFPVPSTSRSALDFLKPTKIHASEETRFAISSDWSPTLDRRYVSSSARLPARR